MTSARNTVIWCVFGIDMNALPGEARQSNLPPEFGQPIDVDAGIFLSCECDHFLRLLFICSSQHLSMPKVQVSQKMPNL
jgi:hypothetical protein